MMMSRLLESRFRRRLAAEIGAIRKPHGSSLRIALAYPNRYFIGMSNVGFQAVYKFWNELPDVVCERVFLPDPEELREHRRTGLPLLSLESQTPVAEFDVLAFSITFEPDELNLVRMLELSRIPPLARDRGEAHPLVVAGG
ncbi:MAG: radical SAM protein, partial [Vicinamibacteria bacterium]